jgi:ketosteroid isomerase-like protein
MHDDEQVLEANAAFYRAFASGDLAGLTALFADGEGLLTAHPFRPVETGRERVLAGWVAILDAGAPPIRALPPRDTRPGAATDVAIVTCLEGTGGSPCVATNVFVRQAGAWRLCHHHGAPLAAVFGAEQDGAIH